MSRQRSPSLTRQLPQIRRKWSQKSRKIKRRNPRNHPSHCLSRAVDRPLRDPAPSPREMPRRFHSREMKVRRAARSLPQRGSAPASRAPTRGLSSASRARNRATRRRRLVEGGRQPTPALQRTLEAVQRREACALRRGRRPAGLISVIWLPPRHPVRCLISAAATCPISLERAGSL